MSTSRQRSSSASSLSTKSNGKTKAAASPTVPPQTSAPQPAIDDRDGWRAHWQAQGQPWRTEPEIDQKRQAELEQRRAIVPDFEKGIYSFKGMKLSRADVEWLLVAPRNEQKPKNLSPLSQQQCEGLDLSGANLSGEDLRDLPMRGAFFREAHLEGAYLRKAHLENANFFMAHLEEAYLREAHLENANLSMAHLEEAYLREAHLENAYLSSAFLKKTFFYQAHLEGANLWMAHLEGCDLTDAFFSNTTNLRKVYLGSEKEGVISVAGLHWDEVDLSVVDWFQITILGDELTARVAKMDKTAPKNFHIQSGEYRTAVRANRQLAGVLQSQGLNEEAAGFFYRAQVLQRRVWWFQLIQHKARLKQRLQALGAWLFSWFLFCLAGYGYRLGRSFFAYLLVIGIFMALYIHLDPQLAWYEAIIVSMTAFHGRGFSPSTFSPGDPLSIVSAIEAFVGLIIEVTFIATLTQRFFNR